MQRSAGRHRAGHASTTDPTGSPSRSPGELTDAELLAAVRSGDTAAFEALYYRHREAARRLARVLVRDPSDAEDLVAEAVAKVLAVLRSGRGPEAAFRAYLLTAVRNACYDRARRDRRIELTDDLSRYESGQGETGEAAMAELERAYAARAFAKLPERWQLVLWHTEVEGEKPATIAVMLGLSPNAVSALAYRARERLRQIYLQEHLTVTNDPSCHWTADRLGAHIRGGLPRRERSKVDAHLASCPNCRMLWAELAEVNAGLQGTLAPAVLGTAAGPYLSTVAGTTGAAWWSALTGSGQAVADAAGRGWAWAADWTQRLVRRYGPNNLAAGIGVTAAALAGIGLFALAMVLGGEEPDPEPPGAAEPRLPVPAPVSPTGAPPPPAPTPTESPATTAPTGVPAGAAPPAGPAPVPTATRTSPPAATAPPGAPPGSRRPTSAQSEPIEVAPDLFTTRLAAGQRGELAIEVHAPAAGGRGDARAELRDRRGSRVGLRLAWPEGITLVGADAGDGWRCTAGAPAQARCQRRPWPAGESRTARVPVAVDESLGGFAPVEAAVTAGGLRGQASFRAPVAPAGQQVRYAGSGRYGSAIAGNTWLTCPATPQCQSDDRLDNHLVPLEPYLPDGAPAGPPETLAASGAELAVPAGAEVIWAGLHWATLGGGGGRAGGAPAGAGPDLVTLHGPGGGQHPVAPDAVQRGSQRPLWQAYAEVTDLVRAGGTGTWWLAATAPLPAGRGVSAGWSLTVVYAHPEEPRRDLAVFTDPGSLPEHGARSVSAAAAGGAVEVEVGVVLWEGDRTLTGDSLRLDGRALGSPENVAASRAAGARECGGAAVEECEWHTFGVDAARYRGTATDGGTVTLRTRHDLLEVGVLTLAVAAPR